MTERKLRELEWNEKIDLSRYIDNHVWESSFGGQFVYIFVIPEQRILQSDVLLWELIGRLNGELIFIKPWVIPSV